MKKTSRSRNSIMNLLTGFGGQLLVIALKFVTRTVFIATLGKEYLGINGLFSDILTMLSLTELGLDTAINFKLYKPLADGDEARVRVLMKFYKDAYRVVGAAILALGLCLIPTLPYLIKDYSSLGQLGINAVLVFALYLMQSVSSYLFFASRSAIVKADQREYMLNMIDYAIRIMACVCQTLILIVWKDFIAYTASLIAFNILQNFINAIIAKHYYPYAFIKTSEHISKAEIKDIYKDLGALFVYKVNAVVVKATDNMVLSAVIGLSIVGMYSNYLMFYTAIRSLLSKAYNSVKASMGNLFAVANMEKKYQFFEVMNLLSIILYGTACVGIAVVADELMTCWIGNGYVIPQPFSVLMGTEILFVGLKNNLAQIRNVSGAFRQMWFRPLLGIIVNLVVSVAMVHSYGIYGVLIGTITADLFANFLVDPSVIHKYSFNNYKRVSVYYIKNIKYILLLFAVGAVDMWLCSMVLPGYGWLSVLIHMVICGMSVPCVFYLIYRKTSEFQYLISLGRKLLNKVKRRIA